MSHADRIMILLVDDRPENLLAYQAILAELDLELVSRDRGPRRSSTSWGTNLR